MISHQFFVTTVISAAMVVMASCSSGDFSGGSGNTSNKKGGSSKESNSSSKTSSTEPGGTSNNTPSTPATPESLSVSEGKVCVPNQDGFGGKVYSIPENSPGIPDLSTLTPLGQITAPNLAVPERSWKKGFPTLPNLTKWFAIRFFGYFDVPADGSYQFKTRSDDGSKLYIDDNLVVNNDGIHDWKTVVTSTSFPLTKGLHKIVVEWFQGPPEKIALEVSWNQGGGWQTIPMNAVKHSQLCDLGMLGTFSN